MKVSPARHDVLKNLPAAAVGDETQLQAEVLGKLQHGTWVMLPVAVMPTTYLLGFFFAISINSLMFFHGAFLAVIRTTGWLTDVL